MVIESAGASSAAVGDDASTVFVSVIGRGRRDEGREPYSRVRYAIEGGEYETPFFAHAVLQSAWGRSVDEVLLLGTRTSTWAALIYEYDAEESALYDALEAETVGPDASGASDENLERLGDLLSRRWNRRVRCQPLAHKEIDDSVAPELASMVVDALAAAGPNRQLLLDVTHGWRTMPLLVLVAHQIADALQPGLAARTRVVYGELAGTRARGVAFTGLQTLAATATAVRRFEETLDGRDLAAVLRPEAPALAEAVERFGGIILSNALRRLGEVVRALENARRGVPDSAPAWVRLASDRVAALVRRIGLNASTPRQILELGRLRRERGHIGLAVLAYSEAAAVLACPEQVETFAALEAATEAFVEKLPGRDRSHFHDLRRMRNQVAHGASLVTKDYASSPEAMAKAAEAMERHVSTWVERYADTRSG